MTSRARALTVGMPIIDGTQWMGGAVYVRNAIYCLASLEQNRRPTIRLTGHVDPSSDYVRELARFDFVDVPGAPTGRLTSMWMRLAPRLPRPLGYMPARMRSINLTFPTFGPPLPGVVPLHWIPDFQHIALPQFFTSAELAQRNESVARIASSDGTLVLSSEAAATDFRQAFPHAAVKTAIYRFCTVLTANEEGGADPSQKYGLPEQFIYLPNQFWAHKNHIIVFKALARLAAEGLRPTLVCTGQEHDRRNPDFVTSLRRFLSEQGLADQVSFLGLVPRADQIEIFRRATFVLQPSLFEGWSTVVEDAKALGRPIVLSDLPVHREQIEDAKDQISYVLFDPNDAHQLAEVIAAAWSRFKGGGAANEQRTRAIADARRQRAGERLLEIFQQALVKDETN